MIFDFPKQPIKRKHGPAGYANYGAYKPWLRDDFTFRCGYCLHRETWSKDGWRDFVLDHFLPQTDRDDLICDYDNLYYVCHACNAHKSDRRLPVEPTKQAYGSFIQFKANGEVAALNPTGEKLIKVLQLDDATRTDFRSKLIDLWERASQETRMKWFGFPNDLPNLTRLRPPDGNSKPEGLARTCHRKKREGQLPETY